MQSRKLMIRKLIKKYFKKECPKCGASVDTSYPFYRLDGSQFVRCKKCGTTIEVGVKMAKNNEKCWFCKSFNLKGKDTFSYDGDKWLITNEKGETGLKGFCSLKNKEITSLDAACYDYNYAYKTDRFCSDEHIMHRCSVNNDCRRADFDCDKCFTKKFWLDDVLKNKDHHFLNENCEGLGFVNSFTKGAGGYGGRRYDILFEDGTLLKDYGMWGRGNCPNELVFNELKHGRSGRLGYFDDFVNERVK